MKMENVSKKYRIAIYLRLSKEDLEMAEESNSISNQRIMLKEYVRKNFEYYELKEFVDDGYSGTNFLRPGVTEMLGQLRAGKLDCVIVKDFSRFSRDYIELGSYIEQIFPFLGIRFISLNDNYDSANMRNTPELDMCFKGLMYDLYSKDLSVKIKSSLQTRRGQGQYANGNTPFGYVKDPDDRHKLVIAEDEARVIKRIFSLALEKKTAMEIAKLFNQEKVKTPREYKMDKKGMNCLPSENRFQWNHEVICSILKNPTYVGDMVYDKYYRKEVGGKNHIKPRSEWKIYKNHHMAIIPREDFEKVQEMRKQVEGRMVEKRKTHHPLQGKVFCGGCKKAMTIRKEVFNPYFYCKKRYIYADVENCVSNINLMFLEQFILYKIDLEVSKQESLQKMIFQKQNVIREKKEKLIKRREELVRRKAVLQRKRLEEYEKAVFNREIIFHTGNTAIQQVDENIAEIDSEIDRLEEQFPRVKNQMTFLHYQGHGLELTEELVKAFIQKIIVYDEEHIEIEWAFDIGENAIV